MEIREVGAAEGLAYREIRLRALRAAPTAFASTFDEESAHPDDFWQDLVARTAGAMEAAILAVDRGDGTFAGTAFVRVSAEPPHDGYVGAMWVDEDLRGAGWADALLDEAERFSQRLGSAAVELWVSGSNPLAQRFYERNGYRPTGVEEPQSSGIIAHMLLKPLPPAGS
jgi:ribosomal protein S18 acetylase RimI-like enzyme